jgi:hypothetical protein
MDMVAKKSAQNPGSTRETDSGSGAIIIKREMMRIITTVKALYTLLMAETARGRTPIHIIQLK